MTDEKVFWWPAMDCHGPALIDSERIDDYWYSSDEYVADSGEIWCDTGCDCWLVGQCLNVEDWDGDGFFGAIRWDGGNWHLEDLE